MREVGGLSSEREGVIACRRQAAQIGEMFRALVSGLSLALIAQQAFIPVVVCKADRAPLILFRTSGKVVLVFPKTKFGRIRLLFFLGLHQNFTIEPGFVIYLNMLCWNFHLFRSPVLRCRYLWGNGWWQGACGPTWGGGRRCCSSKRAERCP
jgi:hypothetical protein